MIEMTTFWQRMSFLVEHALVLTSRKKEKDTKSERLGSGWWGSQRYVPHPEKKKHVVQ